MRIVVLVWLTIATLYAIQGKIELQVDTKEPLFVSQPFTVTLKVMSSGYSIRHLQIDYGEHEAFLIVAPKSAAYNMREGEYNVVVYEYSLYPLQKGPHTIEPWHVTFESSMGYGHEPKRITAKTEPLHVDIASVNGYDFILATPHLTLESNFLHVKKRYEVGDIIQRETLIQAEAVPDLLIPAIHTSLNDDAIQSYQSEPMLSQTHQKALLISKRVQKESFRLLKEGNFSIAGLEIPWYNVDTKKVEIAQTNPLFLHVTAGPSQAVKVSATDSITLRKSVIIIVVLLMLYPLYRGIRQIGRLKTRSHKRSRSLLAESINPKPRNE